MMLLGTAAVGLTAAAMAPASAGEVEKTAGFGGHVNRDVQIIDDGDNTIIAHDDAGTAQSRFKLWGEAKSETLTTKAYIEMAATGNADGDQAAGSSGSSIGIRHSYLSLSNNMGTLTMGQTDPAGNAGTTASLSGAAGYGYYVGTGLIEAGHVTKGTGATDGAQGTLGLTGNDLYDDFTQSRDGVLKYDSPDFNGFGVTIGTKIGNQHGADLTYSADFDGTEVAAQVSYINSAAASTTFDHTAAGSVAVKLASGLNAAVGYGQKGRQSGSGISDPTLLYVELGYDASVIDAGGTSVNVAYQKTDDLSSNGSESETLALNVVQSLSDYGTVLYAGVQQMKHDTTAADFEDITAGWVGVKVAF